MSERSYRIVGCFAAGAAMTVCDPVRAQSMNSLQALSDGAVASSQYAGSTLEVSRDGFHRGTAIRMGSNWGISAGHIFEAPGTYSISNGSNWMTDRGLERTVSRFVLHPLNVPGGWTGNEIDLSVFFWDTPLPGTDLAIAPVVLGELLSYSGFGRPHTPATDYLPGDGQRRMFQTRAGNFGSGIGGVSNDYVVGSFYPPGSSLFLPLGGVGTGGNSGSGVYNQSGQLVAVADAATSPGYFGSTYSLRLDLYSSWIYAQVPSPSSIALLAYGGIVAFRRRR